MNLNVGHNVFGKNNFSHDIINDVDRNIQGGSYRTWFLTVRQTMLVLKQMVHIIFIH